MPTYEYEREDGTRFEIEQRITEDALDKCPTTGQRVKRLIAATSFQLKGSGWYKTDYSSGTKGNGAPSSNRSDSSTTTTTAPEKASKPSEKSTPAPATME